MVKWDRSATNRRTRSKRDVRTVRVVASVMLVSVSRPRNKLISPVLSMAATYDTLRRQSRTLESLVDVKISAYARLASAITLGQDLEAGGSASRREDME